ncbi:23S rRNA (pseudouridine(1915)-N(3))-methyltransferase RlmH [Methylobacterium isbiliense]|uniref:Ribosomal RNA large subunit methyltransferase H n=1 Tax=Methylobacterium isbiliense TaxID=315478 RepID=A0ABQ4SCN5_9HYPH|nr:23S rRNA (pseudouridine(1915)-N(3))-methyltransferase RlmH [Methylobacterium isbiliense]MDN3626217.1 23S rRNA (pseudouridine(1915)-N(3))-methyltransferase RlmH [Methylobacterium isbiliense]GJE00986.1 Ribosomal RNA large subunit methyltransferase H [Methylobacterium isbiliense]
MRLALVAVGRLKRGPERELAETYRARADALARSLGFAPVQVTELPESRARRAPDRCDEEGSLILGAVVPGSVLMVMDEGGRPVTSTGFAERLGAWRDGGRPGLAIVIGGADGLSEAVRQRADLLFAFGAATLPHGLVRVLALEQVYRAMTILAGHPYHRGAP